MWLEEVQCRAGPLSPMKLALFLYVGDHGCGFTEARLADVHRLSKLIAIFGLFFCVHNICLYLNNCLCIISSCFLNVPFPEYLMDAFGVFIYYSCKLVPQGDYCIRSYSDLNFKLASYLPRIIAVGKSQTVL